MRVLIIEDEKPAAEKLMLLLKKYDPKIELLKNTTSIEKSVEYIQAHASDIDLIFQDIQLTDGLSFDIFNKIEVNKPIIFTTAFNEHALEAFKVNSIDYLLKPISYEALEKSMQKIELLKNEFSQKDQTNEQFNQILKALSSTQIKFKTRFLVKIREHIKSISADNISTFYAEGRTVFVLNNEGRKFIIDFKLEELELQLDPVLFFRVNRSFIVNINHIVDVIVYSNSRLKIKLSKEIDKEIIVSREKVNLFKEWFSGER